jgi:hypothetical protein
MTTHIRNKPLHLFFFPLLFVANHFFSITTTDAIFPAAQTLSLWAMKVAISATACLLLPLLTYFLLSRSVSKTKSAVFTSILFIPFFFFQDFLILGNFLLGTEVRIRWFLLLTLLFTAAIGLSVLRSKRKLLMANEALNVLSGLLLAYVLLTLIIFFDKKTPKRLTYDVPLYPLNCTECPDIYFFLLDSYTSNKSLRTYFQFDNKVFTETLHRLGFTVLDEAHSSYNKTIYSLGATLNLDPIDNLDQYYEKDVLKIIENNTVTHSLQQAGYKAHNYSLFDIQDLPRFYSISYEYKMFTNEIFQNTILRFLLDNTGTYLNLYGVHLDILEQVKRDARSRHRSPRFFYIHILAPHAPYVMNAKGEEIQFLEQKTSQEDAYIEQVMGLNKLISETLEVVIKQPKQPIIVILGDHGSRMINGPDQQKESHTVFLAHLIPGRKQGVDLDPSHKIFNVIFESLKMRR